MIKHKYSISVFFLLILFSASSVQNTEVHAASRAVYKAQKKLKKLQKEYKKIKYKIKKDERKALRKLSRPKKRKYKNPDNYQNALERYTKKREAIIHRYERISDRRLNKKQRQIMGILNREYTEKVKIYLRHYDNVIGAFPVKVYGAKRYFKAKIVVPVEQADEFKKNFKKAKSWGTFRIVESRRPYLVAGKTFVKGKKYKVEVPLAYHKFLTHTFPGGKPSFIKSNNDRYLVIAGGSAFKGSRLEVWDTRIWRNIFTVESDPDDEKTDFWASKATFDPSGRYLVAGGTKPRLRSKPISKVYKIRNWSEVATVEGSHAQFSADKQYMITKSLYNKKKAWETKSWTDIRNRFTTDYEFENWIDTLPKCNLCEEGLLSSSRFEIQSINRDKIVLLDNVSQDVAAEIKLRTKYKNPPEDLKTTKAILVSRSKEFYDAEIFSGFTPDGKNLIRAYTHTYPYEGGRGYQTHIEIWRLLWSKKNFN